MQATTTTLCAFFDPDAPQRILAASKSTVTLHVHWHEHEYLDHETDEEADADEGKIIGSGDGALRLPRQLYASAMTEWLDEKSQYCADGQFGGEGFIMFDELERLPGGVPVDAYMTHDGHDASTAAAKVLVQGFGTTRETEFYVEMEQGSGAAPADFDADPLTAEEEATVLKAAATATLERVLATSSVEGIEGLIAIAKTALDRAVAAAAEAAETPATYSTFDDDDEVAAQPVAFFRKADIETVPSV